MTSVPIVDAGPTDVLVAVPAHDEQARIGACLTSVGLALRQAREAGVVRAARIAVALHRCTDDTAAAALVALRRFDEIDHLLWEEPRVLPVGAVRTALVRRAAATPAPLRGDAWLFSTDADTVVPADWVTSTLALRRREPVDLVLGLVDLGQWEAGEAAQQTYAALVDAGVDDDGHRHAYAANLAVRLSAFEAVGGFPALPHGEEHGLAAAIRAAGLRVVSHTAPRVRTSARMPGRAPQGLGALLAGLAEAEDRPGPEPPGPRGRLGA